MPTRVISTKLAIEGESQYRESMVRINGEIKSLQSALKLTESQYQTNANSMAALTAKGGALNDLYKAQSAKVAELKKALENAQNAEAAYAAKKADLTAKIEANNDALNIQDEKVKSAGKSWAYQAEIVSKCETELEKLRNSTEDTSTAQAELEKKISAAKDKMASLESSTGGAARSAGELIAENKELNTELQKNENYLTAAGRGVTSWKDKLSSAQVKLNDINADLKLNEEYLEEAKKSSDGCATSIDRFGDRAQSSAEKADMLSDALMAAGVVAALKATADALEACVDASVDFESAMAGVKKTTDMADDELMAMGDAIQDLATEIPTTASEIANVAEAAGQLGIAKNDILSFSEVMVNLGTATNLSSTEAASSLAKFANVVSMSADNYERLGSTIVALGNNFATTEADIVSMATRLASTGALVGLTEAEIMAVATALSSVGIEAEAGGSAVSKLLKQFEVMVQTGSPQLADFAAIAGMSADEFSNAWGENAVAALSRFIDGLGDVDKAGGSSVAVLEDLGLTEIRLSNAVLAMASSEGILTKSLNLANNAWDENSALSKEAATRYETTESRLQLLANAADNVKIAVGDQLTPAIGDFADAGADACNWLADFIDQNEAVVPMVTATATVIGVLAAGITGYTVATKLASAATAAFTLVLDTNPIFLTATAIAALAAGVGVLAATIDASVPSVSDLTTAADSLRESMEETDAARDATISSTEAAASVAERYISKLEMLEATGLKTDEQQKEYHNTLAMLCQVVPDLAQFIDLETDSIIGGTEALRANTEAWKQNTIQQAYQEQLTKLNKEYADVLVEAEMNSIGLSDATDRLETAGERQTEVQKRMNALMDEATAKWNEAAGTSADLGDATAYLSEEYYALEQELNSLSVEMVVASDEAAKYQKALDEDKEAIAAAEKEIALADEAVENLTKDLEDNSDAANDNASAQQEMAAKTAEVQTRINELAQAYKDAYDSAHDSISDQIGLFDNFAASVSEDTDSVEEMMKRWSDQTANLSAYTENLKKAAEYGLDEGLVMSLSDGSAESAGYLATIIGEIERLGGTTENMGTAAQTFVDNFNSSFAQTEAAKEEFAHTVAAMETDFTDTLAAIEQAANEADFSGVEQSLRDAFANVGLDAEKIGLDVAGGLSTGMESGNGKVIISSKNLGHAAIDACRLVLDSHSDSRVMIGVGKDFVGGMITGISGRQDELTNTVETVGTAMTDTMTMSVKNMVDKSMTEFCKISGRTKTAMAELKTTVTTAASGISLYGTGQDVVNGMIRGMNNRSGALYSTVRGIVNQAIRTAKSAAATASPSKKTTKIFEDVGDGMIVGLENRRQKVKATAKSVVDDALRLDVTSNIGSVIDKINASQAVSFAALSNAASTATAGASASNKHYNTYDIKIYQQRGEDEDALLDRLEHRLQIKFDRKEASR